MLHRDKEFNKIDFSNQTMPSDEYEGCTFLNCDFSNAVLMHSTFDACTFESCNISMANIANAAFRDVEFKECKMLGLQFADCNEFGLSFSFDNCMLNHSSFYKRKLKKIVFKNCQLHETDFAESDITGSLLDNCDLMGAVFNQTIMEKSDFQTSYNYSINPEENRIRGAKFSLQGVAGLLDKYKIVIK